MLAPERHNSKSARAKNAGISLMNGKTSAEIPALEYASRLDARTFVYQGEIQGANQSDALSGTPTMDRGGDLYFVSPRSYSRTLSTVYSGRFDSGRLNGLHLASGISPRTPGVSTSTSR